jgi:hypothetical protein
MRIVTPIDYPVVAAKLKLRGACMTTEHRIDVSGTTRAMRVERPATCADGTLTIVLTESRGPYLDSPLVAILTLTHRASGLCLDPFGSWPATTAGLRLARATLRAVLTASAGLYDWSLVDPVPTGGSARIDAGAVLRKLAVDLLAAK